MTLQRLMQQKYSGFKKQTMPASLQKREVSALQHLGTNVVPSTLRWRFRPAGIKVKQPRLHSFIHKNKTKTTKQTNKKQINQTTPKKSPRVNRLTSFSTNETQ